MELDETICPYCNNDNYTSTYDESLGRTVRHCGECNRLYDVTYEYKVKEIIKRELPVK